MEGAALWGLFCPSPVSICSSPLMLVAELRHSCYPALPCPRSHPQITDVGAPWSPVTATPSARCSITFVPSFVPRSCEDLLIFTGEGGALKEGSPGAGFPGSSLTFPKELLSEGLFELGHGGQGQAGTGFRCAVFCQSS